MTKDTFGESLKREREMRGVTLDEISAATRIATRFLKAIESEEWDQLPGGVFNRGFVRAVARYLGLDEESIVAEYTLAVGDRQTVPVWTGSPPAVTPQQPWLAWIIAAVVLLLILAGGWFGTRRILAWRAARRAAQTAAATGTADAPSSNAESQQTSGGPAAPDNVGLAPGGQNGASGAPAGGTDSASSSVSPPAVTDRFELKIEAGKKTKVIVVADKDVVFDGTMKAGEDQYFSAADHFQISARDAGALHLELNGKPIAPIGPTGRQGKVTLTREALKEPPVAEISTTLVEEIHAGHATTERKLAICSEAAALPPDDRIEPLCVLTADADADVRKKAAAILLTQPLKNVLAALTRPGGAPELFAYCAAEFPRRPGVADALAKNPSCPIEALRPVIRYLSVTTIQDLFEDLDRLSTSPQLVAEMIASGVINAEQRVQLQELQRAEPEPAEAFAEVLKAAETAEPDNAKRETLLQKLSSMRVVERVQLALKGGRSERLLLVRDPCKVVQRAVLQSPQLSEQEVESFSSMATLSDETLRLIAGNRKFMKNYGIMRGLMFNPKTPLEVTLHLLPHLKPMDLKFLSTNKNVGDTLRTAATRLQRRRSRQETE